ncbi:MAG: spore germination protein [Oscillospiraceae bacterium]|nr:spore germination protein [Oscillospiraceae bacterium]
MSEMYPGAISDENIRNIFREAGDFNVRKLKCGQFTLYGYAIDGLTSGGDISEYVFKPIMEQLQGQSMAQLYANALDSVVVNSVAKACQTLDDVAMLLVNGFCVVLFPGEGAIAFETKTGEKRGLQAPDVEHTAKGPKDAFVETVRTNTSLVRRHLRTPDLRLYETKVGRRSLTNVTIVWIDGLTNDELVERMKKRLDTIDIDGMLSPASVEEYITGSRKTAFPLLQYTERTDRFCNGLLKGRVGLFVDGLPLGYLAPVDVGYLMNSPEDLGRDYISASWVRVMRYAALLIGLLLPAVYIAFTTFHRNLIPDMLLQIIDESRDNLPYSAVWEVLGLLMAFELLQESGVHLPQSIGQSVSIIGGIVLGSAAVDAGVISPMALIIVSITGISGFVLPNRDFAAAVRVSRFALALAASVAGLTGLVIGFAILVIHLLRLKSLGVPYIVLFEPNILRQRMVKNKRRDKHLHPKDSQNQR